MNFRKILIIGFLSLVGFGGYSNAMEEPHSSSSSSTSSSTSSSSSPACYACRGHDVPITDNLIISQIEYVEFCLGLLGSKHPAFTGLYYLLENFKACIGNRTELFKCVMHMHERFGFRRVLECVDCPNKIFYLGPLVMGSFFTTKERDFIDHILFFTQCVLKKLGGDRVFVSCLPSLNAVRLLETYPDDLYPIALELSKKGSIIVEPAKTN